MKTLQTLRFRVRCLYVITLLILPSLLQAGDDLEAALLDVTDPEPLPEDHPLWELGNAQVTMHLSGRAQTKMFQRSADRFIENLERWHKGEPVQPQLDLELGY